MTELLQESLWAWQGREEGVQISLFRKAPLIIPCAVCFGKEGIKTTSHLVILWGVLNFSSPCCGLALQGVLMPSSMESLRSPLKPLQTGVTASEHFVPYQEKSRKAAHALVGSPLPDNLQVLEG